MLHREQNPAEGSYDLTMAESALTRARTDINSAVKSYEIADAMKQLGREVLNWRGINPNEFGKPLLCDIVTAILPEKVQIQTVSIVQDQIISPKRYKNNDFLVSGLPV
jgi:hypothetical protein